MESSSHHSIFFSVPPFDQYRLLMAKYRNGVMIRRMPFPIWANCPPSKKACSTGSFVCVRNAMARSAPMEEATTSCKTFHSPSISGILPPDITSSSLADIFLPLAVNGGGGQDAEISILQIPRNRFAARSCHTHCMKEQHGRIPPVAICLKQHFYRLSFP